MAKSPVILAFDTSGPHCAAALGGGTLPPITRFVDMAKGQAEALLPLLEEMLTEAGLNWADLDGLAVGTGPGNFTGIRISVAAARGIALGRSLPAFSITNFEMLLEGIPASDDSAYLVSLPAPRGASYVQLFVEGQPSGAAQMVHPGISGAQMPDTPAGTIVFGHNAAELATTIAPAGAATSLSHGDASLADIPARLLAVATKKWYKGHDPNLRPAPLYVKPPDAAPSREAPPAIVP